VRAEWPIPPVKRKHRRNGGADQLKVILGVLLVVERIFLHLAL
jgi:hypothetical protein